MESFPKDHQLATGGLSICKSTKLSRSSTKRLVIEFVRSASYEFRIHEAVRYEEGGYIVIRV